MTTQITEYSKTDAALAELSSRYSRAVFDVTTTKGMQDAKEARAELRGYRVDLEKVRVEIKSPALERCRLIDAEAKRITAALVDLENPIDATIKAEEERKTREAMEKVMAEQRRKDAILAKIEALRGKALALAGKHSAEIANAIEILEATEITAEEFAEFHGEALTAKDAALSRIRDLLAAQIASELEAIRIRAEREELVKLRAEADTREREHRIRMAEEDRQAREGRAAEDARVATERAKVEAERRAMEAERLREQEAAESARREIARKENEVLDARALLTSFRSRFGHLPEFKGVVDAIDAAIPRKARKAA